MVAAVSEPLVMDLELQPKEQLLLEMMEGDSAIIGYGGSRGGAKSHAVRACALLRRLKYPGTTALVFRRTYDQLWQNHISEMMKEWPGLFKRYWSGDNRALMLPKNSMILFRYADTLKDVYEFQGKQYGDVFIDEATFQTEEELGILGSCCRSVVSGFHPKRVFTFNPGGVGHAYVKRVFIDKNLTDKEKKLKPQFIQAYAWDNVYWMKDALKADGVSTADYFEWPRDKKIEYLLARSDYGRDLDALPEHLRRPWLFGLWDTFVGQVFSEFRRDIHVVQPFPVPSWWKCWLSNDPGINDPGVWHLLCADQDGNVYIVTEWTFDGLPYSEQAKRVAADLAVKNITPDYCVTGMDAHNSNIETGKSYCDHYYEGGLRLNFIKPVHGVGCVAKRTGTMHEYLKVGKGDQGRDTARLRIFANCVKLIETLPMLPADANKPEQVADCPINHWFDSAGYGVQSWHANKSKEDTTPKPYAPMTYGALLGHNKVWHPTKKRSVFALGTA